MSVSELIRSVDWVAAGAAALLVMLGLTMLFTTTTSQGGASALFVRQLFSVVVAIGVYIVLSLMPYHQLARYAPALYATALVALLVVSQAGRVIRGTISRLEVFGIQVQPSEFMKVTIVLVLAWLFARTPTTFHRTLIVSGIAVGSAVALILLEPDVGMAALILMMWASLVLFLGTSWRVLGGLSLLGAIGGIAAWKWLLADFQRERIATFLNPTNDPLGAGYNIVQSIVALGSGGWLGKGLGHGPQSQLQFLPEQHTDFILASLGEELGFVGIVLVIVLYVTLLWRIMRVARNTKDAFAQYIAIGTYLSLLISFFISAGMNMGLLPVTGIPLPLISYGGSSLVSTAMLLGIVQSIHVHNKWVQYEPTELSQFT